MLSLNLYYYSYLASQVSTQLNAVQYSQQYAYADDIENALSGMSYNSKTVTTAEARNATLANGGYTDPPYQAGSPVIGFKPTQSTGNTYVMVKNTNPINSGSFIAKASDIQGLTPAQIRSRFALNYTPTHYCYVTIDSGVQIYTGIAGSNYGMMGGGTQFDIYGQIGSSVHFGVTYILP